MDAYRMGLYTEDELKLYEMGASNFEFHYYGSGKMFAHFWKSFDDVLIKEPGAEEL